MVKNYKSFCHPKSGGQSPRRGYEVIFLRAGPDQEAGLRIVLKLFIFLLTYLFWSAIIYLGKSINFNIVTSINFMNLYILKGGKHYGNH